MGVVREIADKTLIVEALREVSGRDIDSLVVSTSPPVGEKELLSGTNPWLRVVVCLSGEYRFEYYDKGVKEAVLPPDGLLVTLPGGYLVARGDRPYRCAQVIPWDKFTRYLLVENVETQWYHTANPLPASGQSMIQSFRSLPLNGAYDGVREKLAEALLRLALIELEQDNSEKKGKAFGTYHAALEFMRGNLHRWFDRDETARSVGVTPSHLSKLFRRFESCEFNQSLKAIRCERAAALLRDSGLTVDEIASLCGFKTSAHFIRVFKGVMGMPPGAFRNSVPAP